MKQIWIKEADSTNSYLKNHLHEVDPMAMVLAVSQNAGRGQRGNSWESEPGKNLTFSFYIGNGLGSGTNSPICGLHPRNQFVISEAVALAISSALARFRLDAMIKWPNDIYVENKKICGILIENSILENSIIRSIIGIGINVNQTEFLSDAPNPVSMAILKGRQFSLEEVGDIVGNELEKYISMIERPEALHQLYMKRLWRNDGISHPFRDASNGEVFQAMIKEIDPTGILILQTDSGLREYSFKEVAFL